MIAYLDAATGSMIVSAVAGGAAGLSVAGRMGLKRFKDKVGRKSADPVDVAESIEEAGDSDVLSPEPEPAT